MSIHRDTNPITGNFPSDCFLCHEPVGVPCIYWMGTEQIVFHPDCARSFVFKLARDVWEFGND